jgi:hypothetical protein
MERSPSCVMLERLESRNFRSSLTYFENYYLTEITGWSMYGLAQFGDNGNEWGWCTTATGSWWGGDWGFQVWDSDMSDGVHTLTTWNYSADVSGTDTTTLTVGDTTVSDSTDLGASIITSVTLRASAVAARRPRGPILRRLDVA